MKYIVAKIQRHIFPILLILTGLVVIFCSYSPGTLLSGWDTIHPEFNFSIYFSRILQVWQSHQGLGAPPSQSHLGDLPHTIILWFISFIFSLNSLRYVYILSMLIVGPLGIYYFAKKFIFSNHKHLEIYAFLAGLIYLLNLGTLQIFYTPLEMFTTLYGLLGWVYFYSFTFLEHGKKKELLILGVIILILSSASHTATLWYIFYLGLAISLGVYVILNRNLQHLMKRTAIVLTFILLINLYWILPNLYYAKNYSKDVQLSQISRAGSNEFFLRGQKRGTLLDIAMLTNFPFDWSIYNFQSNSYVPQMGEWSTIVHSPFMIVWGVLFFLLFLLGIVISVHKKERKLLTFIPLLLICFVFLRNANFPFTSSFLAIREKFSLFREIFRFPFTKFANFYVLFYCIFISYALYYLILWCKNHMHSHLLQHIFTVIIVGQLFFFLPVLKDGYISPFMKVTVPNEYFQLFDYVNKKPDKRVLYLPLFSSTGWEYHSWGYQGAGFLWFGMQNPVLNREFDRWYFYNEQAYRELSFALYKRDPVLFNQLLSKYNIGYILIDDSIIDTNPKLSKQLSFLRETNQVMAMNPKINLAWDSSFLHLYDTGIISQDNKTFNNLAVVSPSYRYTYEDQAYTDFGNYISTDQDSNYRYYFRSFINETGKVPLTMQNVLGNIYSTPLIILSGDTLQIDQIEKGKNWVKIKNLDSLHIESTDKIVEINYGLANLSQDSAYLFEFQSKNLSGLPLRICLRNNYSFRCDIQEELTKQNSFMSDYFVLPPVNQGSGYTLEVSNVSYGTISSINDLAYIKVSTIPYNLLKHFRETKDKSIDNNYIVTNDQAYEKNWKAYFVTQSNFFTNNFPFLFGTEIKNHVLVNNWANGWRLPSIINNQPSTIVIIFLPQYLEYIGFVLLIGAFVWILRYKESITH